MTMRMSARGALGALVVGLIGLSPSLAQAGSMDLALERLVVDPSCVTSGTQCTPDDDAFLRLVNQYAMAIAPSAMYPARTTGFGGFEIQLQANYMGIDSSADYFQKGTRGATDAATGQNESSNTSVPSIMQTYSLRIRKGFGFGLEVGSEFGFLPDTNIIAGGADVRLALLEGFRESVPGYLPDLAVMGSVRTITGTPEAQITVAGASAVLSKPITISSSGQLTPMVGFQYLWLFGDSGVVDFTPTTDAQQACNFAGPNQPGTPTATGSDGQPICVGGSVTDFNNNAVFQKVRLDRQRIFFGATYRYEFLTFGGQVSMDAVDPEKGQNDAAEADALAGVPKQIGVTVQLGGQF